MPDGAVAIAYAALLLSTQYVPTTSEMNIVTGGRTKAARVTHDVEPATEYVPLSQGVQLALPATATAASQIPKNIPTVGPIMIPAVRK